MHLQKALVLAGIVATATLASPTPAKPSHTSLPDLRLNADHVKTIEPDHTSSLPDRLQAPTKTSEEKKIDSWSWSPESDYGSQNPHYYEPQGDGSDDVFVKPMKEDKKNNKNKMKPNGWISKPRPGRRSLSFPGGEKIPEDPGEKAPGPAPYFCPPLVPGLFCKLPKVISGPGPVVHDNSTATFIPEARGGVIHGHDRVLDVTAKAKLWRVIHGHGPVMNNDPRGRPADFTSKEKAPKDPEHATDEETKDVLSKPHIQGGPDGVRKLLDDNFVISGPVAPGNPVSKFRTAIIPTSTADSAASATATTTPQATEGKVRKEFTA